MGKTLITAFEPFGLIGAWIRRSNTSKQVMDDIEQDYGDEFSYLSLPTSEEGVSKFIETLNKDKPSAILSLGEHLLINPNKVILEPYAHDMGVNTLPLSHLFCETVESDFVQKLEDSATNSHIGGYYCNQVYLQGLNWAKENGDIPVAFLHIPVLGDRQEHKGQVLEIVDKMQNSITSQNPEI